MLLVTTRGYVLEIYAGYGGRQKFFSDARLLTDIVETAKAEIKENDEARNIVTFFDKDVWCFLVDKGFRDIRG